MSRRCQTVILFVITWISSTSLCERHTICISPGEWIGKYSYEIILEILNLDCYIRLENFQAIYGREYRDYTSSDRKSANLTIDELSQAALNTQRYLNKITCSRIDTFSLCTLTTYRQGHLLRELLHARVLATFILRHRGYSFHNDHLYSLQQTLVVNSRDCQRASTSVNESSTTVVYESFQRSSKTLLLRRTLLLLRTLLL